MRDIFEYWAQAILNTMHTFMLSLKDPSLIPWIIQGKYLNCVHMFLREYFSPFMKPLLMVHAYYLHARYFSHWSSSNRIKGEEMLFHCWYKQMIFVEFDCLVDSKFNNINQVYDMYCVKQNKSFFAYWHGKFTNIWKGMKHYTNLLHFLSWRSNIFWF